MEPLNSNFIALAKRTQGTERSGNPSTVKTDRTKHQDPAETETIDLGVTIRMKARLMGLQQAEKNISNAITMLQIADGHVMAMGNTLLKIRKLAVQASNGIYSSNDRQIIQVEVSQLMDEIDRVASQAVYNQMPLLQGDFSRDSRTASMWIQTGANMHERERVFISTLTGRSLYLRNTDGSIISISTPGMANDVIGRLDMALYRIAKQRGDLLGYISRLHRASEDLTEELETLGKKYQVTEDLLNDTIDKIKRNAK